MQVERCDMRGMLLLLAIALSAAGAWAQQKCDVGYLYPAGGQQGTTVRVRAGGQGLRGAVAVHVSGGGIQARIVDFCPPIPQNKLGDVSKHIRAHIRQRMEGGNVRAEELPELPDHPLLRDLDRLSLAELLDLSARVFDPRRQRNTQLAETLLIDVTIARGASPSDRELRVQTRSGMTSPMIFQVGVLPESCESEPNDPSAVEPRLASYITEQPPLDTPVVLNGQIMPGDVDHFRFRATAGQGLVMAVAARHLVPYLADAVPGWFQAVVEVRDEQGRTVAFADDFRFDPDPVLYCEIPADGVYELELRDSIYRGREDFVYRVSICEMPFITWIFPLGAAIDGSAVVDIGGWNLPFDQVRLDTEGDLPLIRRSTWRTGDIPTNEVPYGIDTIPDCMEVEPNDLRADAQRVVLPQIVNGRILQPGDEDHFVFEGRAGQEIVAEIRARVLNSPLDSLLRLIDASGGVVAWNDDHMQRDATLHPDPGLLTHHADSYLRAKLPADGTYCVQVSDAQQAGGEAWGYRLHLRPPQPDFDLRVTPPSLVVAAGRSVPIRVYALRRDGFDGEVRVALGGRIGGFSLQGGVIPAGATSARMTITAPLRPMPDPVALHLEGQAVIAGNAVVRSAVPAEDMMQAFLWRHLVPAEEMLAVVSPALRSAPLLMVADQPPVRIPSGGTAVVTIRGAGQAVPENLEVVLNEPPPGLTIREAQVSEAGLSVVLAADDTALKVGHSENLIFDAVLNVETRLQDGRTRKTRPPIGCLPAIPFEVVEP